MLSPIFSACSSGSGSGSDGGGGGDKAGSASALVLEWNGWTGADNVDNLKDFLARFDKTKPGFKVTNVAYQWDTLFAKLPIAVRSGSAPNTVIMHPSEVPQFAAGLKILEPIDELVSKAGIDLSTLPANAVDACRFEGKLFAVPGDFHPLGMYYNTKHLVTAGLNPKRPPTTKAEFLQWAQELKGKVPAKDMVAPVFIPYNNAPNARWFWWTLLHQHGGSFLNAENTKCTVNSDAGKESLQFLVDLFGSQLATGESGQQTPEAAGKIGMWMTGPWVVPQYIKSKLPFTTDEMPNIGGKQATWSNAHCLTVVKGTTGAKADNTMKFIKWFSDNYGYPANTVGVIPVNPQALEDPVFTGSPNHKYFRPFQKSLSYSVLEPRILKYTEVFTFGKPTPLSINLTKAIQGQKSVAAALQDMEDGINRVLA